jgi:hypothetical protein
MKKLLSSKPFVLILGGIAVLAIIYLTAGIASFKLKPAESFSVQETPTPLQASPGLVPIPVAWPAVLIWAGMLPIFLGIVFILLNPEQRKKLLKALLRLGLWTAAVLLLVSRFREQLIQTEKDKPTPVPAAGNIAGNQAAVPPFVPPNLPAWEIYLISLALLVVLGAGIGWLFWYQRKRAANSLTELAHIARSTLQEIQTGEDWENKIVQCYVRMSSVVGARRNLNRQAAETPTEFAAQLEDAGLPGEAVHRLTLLFERVRYGAKKSTPNDIDEAVESLKAILHACREAL